MTFESQQEVRITTKADELGHILDEIDTPKLPPIYQAILRLIASFLESDTSKLLPAVHFSEITDAIGSDSIYLIHRYSRDSPNVAFDVPGMVQLLTPHRHDALLIICRKEHTHWKDGVVESQTSGCYTGRHDSASIKHKLTAEEWLCVGVEEGYGPDEYDVIEESFRFALLASFLNDDQKITTLFDEIQVVVNCAIFCCHDILRTNSYIFAKSSHKSLLARLHSVLVLVEAFEHIRPYENMTRSGSPSTTAVSTKQ